MTSCVGELANMESARCQYCASLSIAELRFNTTYSHHSSLADLKQCAVSRICDICVLFWTSILQQNSQGGIDLCLSDYASGAQTDQNTNIYLWAYLQDSMGQYHQVRQYGSNILISCGMLGATSQAQVTAYVEIFAEPGECFKLKSSPLFVC